MDRSNRVLAPEVSSFQQAFPQLDKATIEYYETGDGTDYPIGRPSPKKFIHGPPMKLWTGLIPCRNPGCNRGGYEVDQDVSEMAFKKLVQKEYRRRCPGDEGSPKGKRIGRKCMNSLNYRLTLEYKPEFTPARVTLKRILASASFLACPACDYPLVKAKCENENCLSCGEHDFTEVNKRLLRARKNRSGHWWPKAGEQLEVRKEVEVEFLRLRPEQVTQLADGQASEELLQTVKTCAVDSVPILVKLETGWLQVELRGNQVTSGPLSAPYIRNRA